MERSFYPCFMAICLLFKSYLVLQNKRERRDEEKVNKKKNMVMTQLLEASISLSISNVSLVSFFI